jgi:sugar O-acyltransferase (sialic acid O-acetyltransferase NeuD family)
VARLVIYGAGGFGREVVTAARGCGKEIVFLSDEPSAPFRGIRQIAHEDLLPDDEMVIAIADGAVRRRIAGGHSRFASVFAPTSVIGPEVEIGEGAIFCDFSMVTASARIGRHFHCNTSSGHAHDCVIGDFVTFAGGVRCNGNVHIGDGAHIGSQAVLMNGTAKRPLVIGEGAIVGIGAVVVRNVPPYTTVFGNPARAIPRPVTGRGGDHAPKYGK